jgi:putative Mn2+ efflux pump MntP
MIALLGIAISLSLDAFAVSVSSGISIPGLRRFYAIRASFCFGLFQFIMPLAGWHLGSAFMVYIESFDHWIAFGLLAFIGGRMVLKASRKRDANEEPESEGDIRNAGTLLLLALATSIDALAVGISLNIMGSGVWGSAAIIGGVTFIDCFCGFEFGRRIGFALEKGAQIGGGLILIGIGANILLRHLWG